MAAAITARSGSGTVVEAKNAVHIEVTGLEDNVAGVATGDITAISQANPTVVTSAGHGLETGDVITVAESDSTPVIDGEQTVTRTGDDTFTVPVNVTVAGVAGEWTFETDKQGRAIGADRRFYILVDAPAGVDDGKSHLFTPSSDGKHTWDGYIFPADGEYTLRLKDAADDSDVATVGVTVAAA